MCIEAYLIFIALQFVVTIQIISVSTTAFKLTLTIVTNTTILKENCLQTMIVV